MDPARLGVMIPILAVGGFFTWMITLTLTRAYAARLKAQAEGGGLGGAAHEEVLAALDALRREVAELAERVDFTERLLAKGRDAEVGKLDASERRTGSK